MKKQRIPILVTITLIFIAFTVGFFLGRNYNHEQVQLSVPASMQTVPTTAETAPEEAIIETIQETTEVTTEATIAITFPININTAGQEELMALPGIGEVLAQRILDYRDEHGSFQAVEELMNVKGIGEKRMEQILDMITIGE